jgi:hypothetical protein
MNDLLARKKRSLQALWGACTEDVAYTEHGKIYLLDGAKPVIGDPECPEESTRTLWLAPVNHNGKEEYRGRAVFFPVYKKSGSLMVINPDAMNYAHRKAEAIKDAMEFMKKRDDG